MTWKQIPDFPHYFMNEEGSLKREAHNHIDSIGRCYKATEKIYKPEDYAISNSGYYQIRIGRGKLGRQWIYIHRTVAELFIPIIEGKDIINHKDGNKKNNNVSNLEWVNYSENNIHSMRTLMTEEQRKAFGAHAKGKPKSEEHKEKIRQSNIKTKRRNRGNNNGTI